MIYGFPGLEGERNHVLVGRRLEGPGGCVVTKVWAGIDSNGELEGILEVSNLLGLIPCGVESTPRYCLPAASKEARAYFTELGVSNQKYDEVIAPSLNR